MRISRIIKDKEGYKLLCRFTIEDGEILPENLTRDKLMKLEFPIENMSSSKGFWFRPRSERHWNLRDEYFVEPPSAEDA